MQNKIQITQKFPFYGLLILSFFPLFNIKGVSISIILFSLLSLIYLLSDLQKRWSPDFKSFLYTSIPFSLYLIGMLYTDNLNQALKTLETGLPLIIFPLLYFIVLGKKYTINNSIKNKLINSFVISSSILIVIIIFNLIYTDAWLSFFNEEMFLKTTQNRGKDIIRYTITNTPFFGEHPTYFGLISIITILFSIYKISHKHLIYLLSFFIGFIGIIISGSKMAFITLIILAVIFIFTSISSKKNKSIALFGFVALMVVLFTTIPMLHVRFNQVIKTKFVAPEGLRYNSTNIRIAIYQCTFESIKKSPVIGSGTGGYRESMRECFKTFDTNIFKLKNYYYNSHNQYLSFVLSNGIIGLTLFILWLIIILNNAVTNKDLLLLLISITFITIFFTENLLERQTGNVMFSFLVFMLYKYNLQKND